MPDGMLIAGSNGWLGRVVRVEAERRGWEVVGVARQTSSSADIVAADASEIARVIVSSAPSVVVNCIGAAAGDLASMRRANVDLVGELLAAVAEVGARFVHIGSAAEIGDPGGDERLAEECAIIPISDYGQTKAAGSRSVIASSANAVVARLFNVAGPSPPEPSFLAGLVAKVRDSSGWLELGNADIVRDWVSVDFAAQAIVTLGELRAGPRLVHVCSGRGVSHGELAEALGRVLGRRVTISSAGCAGVPAVVGDPALLEATTGLRSMSTVDDLARCVLPAGG